MLHTHRTAVFTAASVIAAAGAIWFNSTALADDASTPTPEVNIRDIMVGAIEPASNALWALVLLQGDINGFSVKQDALCGVALA